MLLSRVISRVVAVAGVSEGHSCLQAEGRQGVGLAELVETALCPGTLDKGRVQRLRPRLPEPSLPGEGGDRKPMLLPGLGLGQRRARGQRKGQPAPGGKELFPVGLAHSGLEARSKRGLGAFSQGRLGTQAAQEIHSLSQKTILPTGSLGRKLQH